MRHTISKATSSDAGNSTVEAVKSLFEELKSRKDLVSQLQELEDPIYAAEILTNNFGTLVLANYNTISRFLVR